MENEKGSETIQQASDQPSDTPVTEVSSPSSPTVSSTPNVTPLIILKANYNDGGVIQRDVASILAEKISDGKLVFDVSNETLGGDPSFGMPKFLFVLYRTPAGDFNVTAKEGEKLVIPSPNAIRFVSKEQPASRSKYPALDEKNGFRKYRLGSPLSEFDIFSFEPCRDTNSDKKTYRPKEFDKKIGSAEIDDISLEFCQDILEEITLTVKGDQNEIALKEAFISAYGEPTTEWQMSVWKGAKTQLLMVQCIGSTVATFSNKDVSAKIDQLRHEKAKEGAVDAVKDL